MPVVIGGMRRLNGRGQATYYHARRRRLGLLAPASTLFRTHTFTTDDTEIDGAVTFGNSGSRLMPVTFAFALLRTGAAAGLVFEFGGEDRGVAVWLDGADVGVAAGAGETASEDDGVTLLADDVLPAAGVAAATLTLTANALDGETVTIGGKIYTFQATLTDVDGNVLIGATASDTLDNLIAAITLDTGAGTLYADSTTEHPDVTAAAGSGDTATITAKTAGDGANSITLGESLASGRWNGPTLRGGTAPYRFVLSVVPNTGAVELFRDGQLVASGAAVNGEFDGGWADDDDGAIGDAAGTVNDRVPGGSQITLAAAQIVGPVSVYLHQRAGA